MNSIGVVAALAAALVSALPAHAQTARSEHPVRTSRIEEDVKSRVNNALAKRFVDASVTDGIPLIR